MTHKNTPFMAGRCGLGLVLLALCLQPGLSVAAHRAGYSMQVLVNGVPLTEHNTRGTTYVEAIENAEYSLRVTNHTGQRIAVALAVDGLNSIDAKTTPARAARKWVLDGYESITVDGWQVDADTARRFFFTTEARSYGAWLGRTTNLGVIEAAVFRERQPVQRYQEQRRGKSRMPAAPEAQSAPRSGQAPGVEPEGALGGDLSDDYAATGIGRHVGNRVQKVRFYAESAPAAQLRIRYEFRPQLVRLGVLPQVPEDISLDRRERANGFSDSDFAPDPDWCDGARH